MHGSGEFLVTDRYGETVPEPFGVVRRNDFIRSRGQDAEGAIDGALRIHEQEKDPACV